MFHPKDLGVPGAADFLSGIGALVQLPLLQRRFDEAAGLNTGGLISGYRGSPLGGYDMQLWRAEAALNDANIQFQPGLNEDLAATALWGAQQQAAFGPASVDGVFGIWYGKGPGVDRTGDVFRSANVFGTSALGGVLAVSGDDHAAQSSTFPHQSDGIFQACLMPVLQPSSVAEIITYGLAGIALSRFSGLWVALKTVAEVAEASATTQLPQHAQLYRAPDLALPAHGLNWDPALNPLINRLELERRVIEERLPAAKAWIAVNGLNAPVVKPSASKLCIVTTGKAHQDVMQVLEDLEIDQEEADALGLGVFKYAVSWPLEVETLLNHFGGCAEFLVVEEKQPVVEDQLKASLFGRPYTITGKTDETGARQLRATLELSPRDVAHALLGRLAKYGSDAALLEHLQERCDAAYPLARPKADPLPPRAPFFCAGCPHNTSTKTPDGSHAGAGIGCHVMALGIPAAKTETVCHMGGEGAQWIGASAFSKRSHMFQNLGDGTYQHSGLLAIRAAVAAKTPITYKILYNDAVAMTGGQAAEGGPTPPQITRQLAAEGVEKIALVSDDANRWRGAGDVAPGTHIADRSALNTLQKEFRAYPGVSAIVYEQTCAAEKRRKRKKGTYPDPDKRIFINSRVCEGCGDCSKQSSCIAVEPKETDFGTKRAINQSSCNKDFSCVSGFCPSFVEVGGAQRKTPDAAAISAKEAALFTGLPTPALSPLTKPYNIFVTGIGGLGVLTLGAVLGQAARHDGLSASVLDFTGLAQKNGAVVAHVRLGPQGAEVHSARLPDGRADLLIAADSLVAAAPGNLAKLNPARTQAVVNLDETPTAEGIFDRDFKVPTAEAMAALDMHIAPGKLHTAAATQLASDIFGQSIAANVLLLGYAWQCGLVPLSEDALLQAVEDNGAAVAMNKRAFAWGRLAAHDMAAAQDALIERPLDVDTRSPQQRFAAELSVYQNEAYAGRYTALIEQTAQAVKGTGAAGQAYLDAVTANAYKVMAYKDEYEVARLYSRGSFKAQLGDQFSDWSSLKLWLAPPMLSRFKDANGRPRKFKFGHWILPVFDGLRRLKGLRGTAFDPFGRSAERKAERALRDDYLALIETLNTEFNANSADAAVTLARLPDEVRGYGPVKEEALKAFPKRLNAAMAVYDAVRL